MLLQSSRIGKNSLAFATFFFLSTAVLAADLRLNYYCITNNDTTGSNCSTGETQFYSEVTDLGSDTSGANRVQFDFFNAGPTESVISEVYFDDGTLLGIAEIIDADTGGDPSIDFSQSANPSKLPGGNTINPQFEVTAGFLADADNPAPKWGIEPGEQLGIIFNLKNGGSYEDIAAELADGRLRIGIHAVSIGATVDSESFVNKPVPLPATIWLFLSGLLGLALKIRKARPST